MKYGKILLLFIIIQLVAIPLLSQDNKDKLQLHNSKVYVYKIKKKELDYFYNLASRSSLDPKEFTHTFVTSYKTGQPTPALPKGIYLLMKPVNNAVQATPFIVYDYKMFQMSNKEMERIFIYDNYGNALNNQNITIGKDKARFDTLTQTFVFENFLSKKLLYGKVSDDHQYNHLYISKRSDINSNSQIVSAFDNQLLRQSYTAKRYVKPYKLSIAPDKAAYLEGEVPIITIKAEVNDPVTTNAQDSLKLEFAINTKFVKQYADSVIYIPSLLDEKKQISIKLGEATQFALPADIFAKSNSTYTFTVKLLDEYKSQSESVDIYYQSLDWGLQLTQQANNLNIDVSSPLKAGKGILEAYDPHNKRLFAETFESSTSVHIPPTVAYYKAWMVGMYDHIQVDASTFPFESSIEYKKDSVSISINNLYNTPCWYTIFNKKKRIGEGFTRDAIRVEAKGKKKDKYLLRLVYLDAGRWMRVILDLNDKSRSTYPPETLGAYSSYDCRVSGDFNHNSSKDIFARVPQSMIDTLKSNAIDRLYQLSDAYAQDKQIYSQTSLKLDFVGQWEHKPQYVLLLGNEEEGKKIKILQPNRMALQTYLKDESSQYDMYVLCENNMYIHKKIDVKANGWNCVSILSNPIPLANDSVSVERLSEELLNSRTTLTIHVTDYIREPMIGATVYLEDMRQKKYMIDIDGMVKIEIPVNYKGKIHIRYIGYEDENIKYNGQTEMHVVLKERDDRLM